MSVPNSEEETFTLYLPTTYHPEEGSPILFIFSPSGNGKKGVKTFIKTAEAYNHILICSNNSRNGPLDQNLLITQHLFNHVFSEFKIFENRIYLAGFSGGARLAAGIASATTQVEGVIAYGAGLIPSPNYMPSKKNFSYIGICGDRDMNYQEMFDVQAYLDNLKIPNSLISFDGNHRWPPNEQLLMAFNWLEIEAINNRMLNIYAISTSAPNGSRPNLFIKYDMIDNIGQYAVSGTKNNGDYLATNGDDLEIEVSDFDQVGDLITVTFDNGEFRGELTVELDKIVESGEVRGPYG